VDFYGVFGFIVQVLTYGFAIYLLVKIFKSYRSNKNPLDLGLTALVLSLLSLELMDFLKSQLKLIDIDIMAYLSWGELSMTDVLWELYAVVFFWFILYIYGIKQLYTLPLVIGGFFEAYIYYTGENGADEMYITIVIVVSALIMLINSIRNKNGISFGIFLATLVGIPEYFLNNYWLSLVAPILIFIVFYLAVDGFWDEKIFYDREKRKKIQNTWISHVVR
jgi:hypothetical protein